MQQLIGWFVKIVFDTPHETLVRFHYRTFLM